MVHLICMPPTISDHLRLHPPTLWCHSDAHCISSHNHATPVAGLNLDQCLISLDLVPMSRATAYLSFSPYAAVDSVGALNHATNPNYPDTEPRMRRIKTRTRPSVSGSTVAKTHFSNQNKQMNPLFQKLDRP